MINIKHLRRMFPWSTEVATEVVLYKELFLKFLQNSQENICAGVSFLRKG